MDKEDLVKLLIEKDNEIEHLKHIIDGWGTVMHLTGDSNEYLTDENPVVNNNPLGLLVPEPF